MTESRLNQLNDEEYSSRIVNTFWPLDRLQITSYFWEELFPLFFGQFDTIFSAISMDAAYKNSKTLVYRFCKVS